jgi:alanine transaminase
MSSKLGRISINSINNAVKSAQYAVRGPIVSKSLKYKEELSQPASTLPFDEITSCNIGNPHELNQVPISYIRDVLSLVINPTLIDRCGTSIFNEDVINRAKKYLDRSRKGVVGMGAYTESKGMRVVRDDIADFLEERDGFRGNIENLFLTNGASSGVTLCVQTLIREGEGILTPIPQYPLYSALTTLNNAELVPYYLDESSNWSTQASHLIEVINKAKQDKIPLKALVVINPGNPTGQIMKREDMEAVIEICVDENIILMADEVYQTNIYKKGAEFLSFRKVAYEMGVLDVSDDSSSGLQLISFHSISKGFVGECGLRGGYFEIHGIPNNVVDEMYKLSSTALCSNTIGQVATGLMVQPPKQGEASYAQYQQERDDILASLKRRATVATEKLNDLDGIDCQEIEGALYAFPSIHLSDKAISLAKEAAMEPDAYYCDKLLDATGIVVVPGSGFKQVDGTFHFRTTILPPEDQTQRYFEKLATFHNDFMKNHA